MIEKTAQLLTELGKRYPGLKTPYRLKTYYSTEQQVFLNCDNDPEGCLQQNLSDPNPPAFRVFYVTQDKKDESYTLSETAYDNFPESSLEKWIPRYHKQLQPGGEAGLEASGKKYVEYVGAEIRE
jgi:hypothetical protein